MNFELFKKYHSEVVMNCQCIEHDLKWIYAYMRTGDVDRNFNKLEKKTLGMLVQKLENLDNSDGNPLISADDYEFLRQLTDKRNFWCHQCFIDFIYIESFINSPQYRSVCNKLLEDHERFDTVSDNVEKLRLKVVNIYKR